MEKKREATLSSDSGLNWGFRFIKQMAGSGVLAQSHLLSGEGPALR